MSISKILYYIILQSFKYLSAIDVPVYLLHVDSLHCLYKKDIQVFINGFYQSIVDALKCASSVSVPRKSREFYNIGWMKLSALKQVACDSFKIWAALGKPKHGNGFDAMKRDKVAYKLAIRRKERNSKNDFTNSLNDALLCKDMGHFWSMWRSKFDSTGRSSLIDDCCNEESIANTFASVFQAAGQPNSQVRHEQLKSAFHSKFDSYTDNLYIMSCTVELVDQCVRNLKRGKAAGHDDLTAEHVQNSHPLLMVLLWSALW